MEQGHQPGQRQARWTEALGLVAILAIALVAYLVSRPPEPAPDPTATAAAPADPAFREQEIVEGGSVEQRAERARQRNERSGRRERGGRDSVPRARRVADLAGRAEAGACIPAGKARMRVVSFNVHSGWNRGRTQQMLPTLVQEMKALDADVILLQEVDQNRPVSGYVDQPAYYAERLGMAYVFATNVLRPGENRYGTAVLSRFPVAEHRNQALPRPPGTQQRGLLRTEIEVLPGVRIAVYNTHLEHTSEQARVLQARAIAERLAADPLPVVLGGDLNAGPDSPPLAALRTQVVDTWPLAGRGSTGATHPQVSPRGRIDYVMAGGELTPLASYVVPGVVSDHRAVVLDLDLSGVLSGTGALCG